MRGPGNKIRRPRDLTSAGKTASLICSSITDGPVTLLCAGIKLALYYRRFAAHLVKGFPFLLEKSGNFFNGFLKIKFPIPCPPNISDSFATYILRRSSAWSENIIFKRYLSRSSSGRLRFNWLVSSFHRQLYINQPQLLFVALSMPEILVPTQLWFSLSRFTSGKANSFGTVRIFSFL